MPPSQSIQLLILFGTMTILEVAHGIAVDSFNNLAVGNGEVNGISNGVPAVGIMNGRAAANSFVALPNSVAATGMTGVGSNSFRANIGGAGSFQNNAGVSLVPTSFAAVGGNTYSRMPSMGMGMSGYGGGMMYEYEPMYQNIYMENAARWALFRQQMLMWAAQLRARLRMTYSPYPYAAYYYEPYARKA